MNATHRLLLLLASLALAVSTGCGPSIAEQFAKAKATGTTQALDGFAAANPEHPYVEELAAAREEVRFKEAQAEGTVEALEAFLSDFPDGSNADKAGEMLEGLRWAKAEELRKIKGYRAYLRHHPDGPRVGDAKEAIHELMLARLERSGSLKKLRAFARRKSLSKAHRAKAYELLDAAVKKKAADRGLLRMARKKDGQIVAYDWVTGFAAGRWLKLDTSKLKPPKALVWKKRRRKVKAPTFKGTVRLTVVEEPGDAPLHLVGVLYTGGKAYVTSQKAKLKRKRLIRKGKGKLKVKLLWRDAPPASGDGAIHLMLVAGDEVPAKAKELKPISDIVTIEVPVQVPAAD